VRRPGLPTAAGFERLLACSLAPPLFILSSPGVLTANSMRFCRYRKEQPSSDLDPIVCPDHTDVGLVTLILRALKPGLECWVPGRSGNKGAWADVESAASVGTRTWSELGLTCCL
jgi:isopenicillin N synthase-like dioxygenase